MTCPWYGPCHSGCWCCPAAAWSMIYRLRSALAQEG